MSCVHGRSPVSRHFCPEVMSEREPSLKSTTKFTNCCGTYFKDGLDDTMAENVLRDLANVRDVRYTCGQLERCPTTQRLHLQFYVQRVSSTRFSWWKKNMPPGANLDRQRRTNIAAKEYAMKEDTRVAGPWEFGLFCGGQGKRTDLEEAAAVVRKYKDPEAVARVAGMDAVYIRHSRGLAALANAIGEDRTRAPLVTIIFGPTGTGKSYSARQDSPNAYYPDQDGTHTWFTGWNGHRDIVFDDFRWEKYPLSLMLRLLDSTPNRVSVHGGQMRCGNFNHVYFTTNEPADTWWPNAKLMHKEAFWRRVTFYYGMPKRGELIPIDKPF